jgi:hypothetical protein
MTVLAFQATARFPVGTPEDGAAIARAAGGDLAYPSGHPTLDGQSISASSVG